MRYGTELEMESVFKNTHFRECLVRNAVGGVDLLVDRLHHSFQLALHDGGDLLFLGPQLPAGFHLFVGLERLQPRLRSKATEFWELAKRIDALEFGAISVLLLLLLVRGTVAFLCDK